MDMLFNMAPDTAFSALDTYIATLAESARLTAQAENRSRYRDHLACAAVVFHLLHVHDVAGAKKLVMEERRSYGWDFLTGQEGAAAETAFSTFAEFMGRL
jgi:hypothetical protein